MRWYAACREACTCRVGGSALPSRAGAGLTLSDVPASSRTPARTRFRPTSMLAGRPAPLSFPSAPPAEFALTACRVDGRHAWPVSPQAGAVFRAVSTTPRRHAPRTAWRSGAAAGGPGRAASAQFFGARTVPCSASTRGAPPVASLGRRRRFSVSVCKAEVCEAAVHGLHGLHRSRRRQRSRSRRGHRHPAPVCRPCRPGRRRHGADDAALPRNRL